MTSDATSSTRSPLREAMREGGRELSGYWGWFLILGILWTLFGTYVLSYRVGSLAAVAALVGVAFLFGGITQLVVASRVQSWRWLYILSGILGVAAGIGTFFWPDITLYVVSILVAWYLIAFGIIHLVDALAGPKVGWWWTGLLLGVAELALGRVGGAFLGAVAADPDDPGRGVGHRLWGEPDLRRLHPARSRQANGAAGRLSTTASRDQLPCRTRQGS